MMKKTLALIFLVAAAAVAAEHHSPLKSNAAFDRMKSLVGDWKAEVPNMGSVIATYSIHSDGSALLEELKMDKEPSMITVYYPAGNDIVMTHYCSGHNQPHMKASGADAQSVKFTTTSIDNLGSASDEHMNAVQFTFRDNDHFTATWNNIAAGKSMAVPFEFSRVR
jgi:hypothetical protein